MTALHRLDLSENSIDHECVEVLINGLVDCKHLWSLDLSRNWIGDSGLEMLVQGLPASVDALDLRRNEIVLARQLPLLRFKKILLEGNSLSSGGPRVLAESLANPECCLEELYLYSASIGDEDVAIVAESLRSNQD